MFGPHLLRPVIAALCVAAMFLFMGASAATIVNRVQHSAEGTAPHEHMILSDISYLADHDDSLHDADHHGQQVAKAGEQGHAQNGDVHSLLGGDPDNSDHANHVGHHHHHHGEVGGSLIVLVGSGVSLDDWHTSGLGLVSDQIVTGSWHPLPDRPPRTLEIRA